MLVSTKHQYMPSKSSINQTSVYAERQEITEQDSVSQGRQFEEMTELHSDDRGDEHSID